jgi:hypothetical protein
MVLQQVGWAVLRGFAEPHIISGRNDS